MSLDWVFEGDLIFIFFFFVERFLEEVEVVFLRLGEGFLFFFFLWLFDFFFLEFDLDFVEFFLDGEGDLDFVDCGREFDIFLEFVRFGFLFEVRVGLGFLDFWRKERFLMCL